ncbi:MAG TPA: tetratricopeptide repeat protein [Gemmataceae bacterium]|jgi:tetratricopeptide (TPR) repeat protein
MKRSFGVVAGVMGLTIALMTATLPAEEPAKKADEANPQWQRYLQGEDAKKATVQEKSRDKTQGTDHREAVEPRSAVEKFRRVLQATKEDQQSYISTFTMQREADTLVAKGRYREAQPLLKQILAIRRKVLGEEHPDTATSYNNVAYNLQAQGKYQEAEEGYRKALTIYRKLLGEEHPDTAGGYNNLGLNLNAQGKYREAEANLLKALAIWRNLLGEEHPNTATSYDNVAYNLESQGRSKDAEEGLRRALAIRRKVLGEEHPDTAISYDNVAYNLNARGKYKEAEESYRKALAVRRMVLGEEHPDTAGGYNNLAYNLDAQGKHKEAEVGYRKALAILRKVLGEEHPDTAASYNNWAVSLNAQGRYKEAEEGYLKALAIYRRVLGEGHPKTALSYNNVAYNLQAQGKYQEAEEGYRKALTIYRKLLGEEHPDTARSCNNLAVNLNTQGKYNEAEEDLRKALAIFRKVLGEENPNTAKSNNNLAANLYAQGEYKAAERFFLCGADTFAKVRLHVAATGLERAVITSKHSPLLWLAAVLARNGKPDNAWQRFEESLARGTWDDLTARLRCPQAERDKQAQITARVDQLNQLIDKINAAKLTNDQTKQREELLSQLRQAYDELATFTRQLEEKFGPVGGQVSPRVKIQKVLPADAALIAWVDITGQPKGVDPNGEHWAILLRSTGDPIWLRLPGSGDKDAWTDADTQLPARLRAALRSARSDWQPLADRLRKQRLDPLAQHLKGVRRLIVLPSTALAGVPVEVIADGYTVSYAHSGTMYAHLRSQPAPTGKGLLVLADPVFDLPTEKEETQLVPPGGVLLTMVLPGSNAASAGLRPNDVLLRYGSTDLNAPADLKLQPDSNDPKKLVPVIVWREGKTRKEPFYVRPGKLGVVIAQKPAPQAIAEQRRLNRLVSRGGDDDKWDRLPGTRLEAASLQHLFEMDAPVQLLLSSNASEQRLNELAQRAELGKYRYIHLATHGQVNDTFPLRSAVILSRDHLPDDKQRTELLLSGQPIPDGRLEAGEALRYWNLHCDLVTLSACQTALGKYESGEGFVGFAQSFILCGARSVCLSLWQVDDTATALLMERFYQNLLGKREGLKSLLAKAAALAEAKDWLRNLSRKEAIRHAAALTEGIPRGKGTVKLPPLRVPFALEKTNPDDHPFAHPYYWAAFVLFGQAD